MPHGNGAIRGRAVLSLSLDGQKCAKIHSRLRVILLGDASSGKSSELSQYQHFVGAKVCGTES